jgi:hypothetical protein
MVGLVRNCNDNLGQSCFNMGGKVAWGMTFCCGPETFTWMTCATPDNDGTIGTWVNLDFCEAPTTFCVGQLRRDWSLKY